MNSFIKTIEQYLSHAALFLQAQTSSVSMPNLGYQWLIMLFALLVLILAMFTLGRSRSALMIIALYIASFIESRILLFSPYGGIRNIGLMEWQIRAGVFVVTAVVVFLLLNKTYLQKRISTAESSSWSVLPLIAIAVGFLVSVLLSFVVAQKGIVIPPLVRMIFTTKIAQLVWTLVPLAGIFFLDRDR